MNIYDEQMKRDIESEELRAEYHKKRPKHARTTSLDIAEPEVDPEACSISPDGLHQYHIDGCSYECGIGHPK